MMRSRPVGFTSAGDRLMRRSAFWRAFLPICQVAVIAFAVWFFYSRA
jgi:hypothetical protein